MWVQKIKLNIYKKSARKRENVHLCDARLCKGGTLAPACVDPFGKSTTARRQRVRRGRARERERKEGDV